MEVVVRLVSLCLFYVSLVLGVEIIDVVEQSVFGQGNGEFYFRKIVYNFKFLINQGNRCD